MDETKFLAISKLIQKRPQTTRNPEEDSAQKVQTNSESMKNYGEQGSNAVL